MARRSLTADEYRAHEEWLRAWEFQHTDDLGCAGDLLLRLEALGVGLDDVVRVLLLSDRATPRTLPAPIEDACAHYRIGVFRLDDRRWAAGAQLGAYNGCLFLAWTV